MENYSDNRTKNLSEEEKQAQTERALELQQLEDREFQGTYHIE